MKKNWEIYGEIRIQVQYLLVRRKEKWECAWYVDECMCTLRPHWYNSSLKKWSKPLFKNVRTSLEGEGARAGRGQILGRCAASKSKQAELILHLKIRRNDKIIILESKAFGFVFVMNTKNHYDTLTF